MIKTFNDLFASWDDVKQQFEMAEKKPDQILYANYSYESYSGDASVVYRRGKKFYEVSGGHCSCNGLEGQWSPEEYTKTAFIAVLKRRIEEWKNNEYYKDKIVIEQFILKKVQAFKTK